MRVDAFALLGLVATLCSCAPPPPSRPANLTLGARASGTVALAASDAAPKIVGMAFNTLDIARGGAWSGDFVTSTNVASLEVRSNLFSIDVPRRTFGRFHFDVDVFDLPPIFVRSYAVRVIARNSAGRQAEEDVPLRIR
jgi:hypothetical protein